MVALLVQLLPAKLNRLDEIFALLGYYTA